MGVTRSTRALPKGAREEAEARQTVIRGALQELRFEVMPRHRPMDIDHWERTRGQDVIRVVAQAQYDNAELVQLTHGIILTAQGYQLEPLGHIRPGAFSGRMPDGDPLDMIPAAVANRVRERLATGSTPLRAWQAGGELLATITQTALSDSSRMAKMVAGLATPRTLYVRILTPPSCARCAVLAGKKGFWDKPFKRHPGCDCSQIPIPMDSDDTWEGPSFDGMAFFNSLSEREQNRYFTRSGAEAIRQGADLAQVVNAQSGMAGVGERYTRAGASRRSQAIQYHLGTTDVPRGTPAFNRLSVPRIIRQTDGDPKRRIAQLYSNGYLTSVRPGRRLDDVLEEINNSRGARGKHTAAARAARATQSPAAVKQRPVSIAANAEQRSGMAVPVVLPSRLRHAVERSDPRPTITEDRWRHILDGEPPGKNGKLQGGHRSGTGRIGKTEFPPEWDDDRIKLAVQRTLDDPHASEMQGTTRRLFRVEDRVLIEASYYPLPGGPVLLRTAFARNGDTVIYNGEDGPEDRPLDLSVLPREE